MDQLETALIAWFADRYGTKYPGLKELLAAARIQDRDFTAGGGILIGLNLDSSVSRTFPVKLPPNVSCLEGPHISSGELESGASSFLFLSEDHVDFIEVWCHANDYPVGRNPERFQLQELLGNYVDLRGDL